MNATRNYLAALVFSAAASMPIARAADPAPVNADIVRKLEQRLDEVQQELVSMKQQITELKAQNEALSSAQQQQAAQAQPQAAQVAAAGEAARPASGGISENLSLWGYGEIYYTHPTHFPQDTQFDLARAVFGIGYRFDDRTVFNSEFEVEHAVASADDVGEFEVEQFYVDHQLAPWASIKAGLFLMPFGLLNEHHEPTNYYGVQRNFVETLIIPSTWREGGFGLHGNTEIGLNWDAGVTTGLNLGGWEINPEDPQYRTALDLENNGVAPMQATHQELSLANGHHLSQYLSLNYSGIPGLLAGAAVFTGEAAVPTTPAGLPSQRVTLWEGHARWTPGAAELSAVYAKATSRTPRLSISPTPALPILCRPSSSVTTCRAPIRYGRTAAIDSRRSPAGNTTTWAPLMRGFLRDSRRCPPGLLRMVVRGRSREIAFGPWVPVSM